MRDPIDIAAAVWCFVLLAGGPMAGWFFMVADYRAYLRSLKRALVWVGNYATTPYWALLDRPQCLEALGLERGCTAEDVMAAYRRLVKIAHPDHGGSREEFERLQQNLREALRLVNEGATDGVSHHADGSASA